MIRKIALTLALIAFTGFAAHASNLANDQASNYSVGGWADGSNQGTGFGPWSFFSGGAGAAGQYLGGTGLGAATFGLFAEGGANASVNRPFTGGGLTAGQGFSIDLGYSNNVGNGAIIGLNLLSGGNPVFTFQFTGGQNFWQLNDGGSNFDTTIPFQPNTPMSFSFTYNGGSSYSLSITQGSNNYTATNFMATNPINNIDGVRLFNNGQGGGENFGFDNLAVIPEPSSLSLLAGPALLGAWFYVRRRRS